MKQSLKKITVRLASAGAVAALALTAGAGPAAAHHDYQPPNYWLCKPFPFLCGGR